MRWGWSLAVQPDCLKGRVVCGTVYGKRSPVIIRKSRVSYPGPGFLSSATWPSQCNVMDCHVTARGSIPGRNGVFIELHVQGTVNGVAVSK